MVAVHQLQSLLVDADDAPDCVQRQGQRADLGRRQRIATDEKTALTVNYGEYLPDDAVDHDGLIEQSPFDAGGRTFARTSDKHRANHGRRVQPPPRR